MIKKAAFGPLRKESNHIMDKVSFRRIKIIDILSEEDTWFKIEDIACSLACTQKTIRTDIQFINSIFPENWQIETIKGKGVYLHKPKISSNEEIYTLFVKNSYTYHAILHILLRNVTVISELGKEFLTQQYSTVYKVLDQVEELLKYYDLTLKRAPLQINGLEADKRKLCTDVTYELYSNSDDWPLEAYSYSYIEKVVTEATEKYHIFLYPTSMKKYIYFIGTLISRIHFEVELNLSKMLENKIKESVFYYIANEIFDQIEKNDKLIFSSSDRLSFAIYISHISYFSPDQQDEDTIYTLFKNKANSYYNELFVLLDLLERHTGIQLMEDKSFVYTFHQQYQIYSLKKYFPQRNIPKDIRRFDKIIKYAQKNYPELYKKVDAAFECFTNNFSLPSSHNIATARATLNIQATVNYSKMKKRVLFFNSEGPGVRRYNMSKLEKYFGNKITFVSYNKLKITKQDLKELAIDFVISDFSLDIENFPFISIDPVITQRELNEIAKYI